MAALLCVCVFAGILYLYSPALNGHFTFDDSGLPFCSATRHGPLSDWISSTGVRPVLIFSYWVNYYFWGVSPFSYHFVNLIVHYINTGLVFLVLLRLIKKAGWPQPRAGVASIIGALVFAIHPLQTESVSYVAGRSESLAALFLLLAYVVFLYRRNESISWVEALLVLVLFGAGVKTKENAVSLAAVLVLTDMFWPTPFSVRGLKRNWRLYCLMLPGAAAAAVAVFRMLATSQTAGFSVPTFKWYQYLFTEARVLFTYIRLAIFPVGQSLDHDYATSHNIMEHGAIYYMILLAALVLVSVVLRRRYPLSCFGLLMFLIWLAPTSSIVPLDDALVERRMYLPLVGLILIGCEVGMRLRLSPAAGATVLCLVGLIFGKLCYDRNRLWGEPDKLLELAAANAVHNPRPLLNFTEILIQRNRCDLAPPYLERAEHRLPNNYYVNVAWGRTLACLGYFDQAIKRLQAAARLNSRSQVYEWMGLVYAQMGRLEEAGGTLKKAVRLDPKSESAHGSLALWYEKTNDLEDAEREYRIATYLDRDDLWAREGWMRVHAVETERHADF
jgi:tetratricopeptide (TPR) repeat protein